MWLRLVLSDPSVVLRERIGPGWAQPTTRPDRARYSTVLGYWPVDMEGPCRYRDSSITVNLSTRSGSGPMRFGETFGRLGRIIGRGTIVGQRLDLLIRSLRRGRLDPAEREEQRHGQCRHRRADQGAQQ